MTIDKSALKALAEAATQGAWIFDGCTLNDWDAGGYSMEWMPNGEDCEDGTNSNYREDGAYMAAANPSKILALLAEIEGLHSQHARDGGELRKLCSARDSARRQRDQLKAENESLRKDAERYRQMRSMTLNQLDETTDQFDAEFDFQIAAYMDALKGQ